MKIDCGTCRIRRWRSGDEPSLAENANNRAVWINLRDRFPHPYTLKDANDWVLHASGQTPLTNLAIEVDGQAVGGIGLVLNNDVERVSAEIGYWLGEPYWGRGVTTNAVRAVTEYGFATFELTRIFALPFGHNSASLRVLEKAGYGREGVLRRSAIKEGQVLDQIVYAVTDLEYD
ncbi:MAG: GNAT family N-acetyltransferase [Gemmatimonas sp.]|nr:GNAT family N-acetyltransferase [Gemmatimonas sp.]